MTSPNSHKLRQTLRTIIELLVRKDFEALRYLCPGSRIPITEVGQVLDEYPGIFVMPPTEALDSANIYPIEGMGLQEWRIDLDLWTLEEGQSDLTLQLTLRDTPGELYSAKIDNIHVL